MNKIWLPAFFFCLVFSGFAQSTQEKVRVIRVSPLHEETKVTQNEESNVATHSPKDSQNLKKSDAVISSQEVTVKSDNNKSENEVNLIDFTVKSGSYLESLNRIAKLIGYNTPVLLNNFPTSCDWHIPYDYSLPIESNKEKDVISGFLTKQGFGDIRFFEYNKTITAKYTGSLVAISSCLKGEKTL